MVQLQFTTCQCGCGNTIPLLSSQGKPRKYSIGHAPKKHHGGSQRVPLTERFWEKVQITSGCWLWLGGFHRAGYGQINAGAPNPRMILAHRVAWELTLGPIPNGLLVLHYCDNPPRVNPSHLFLGTQRDNVKDMMQKGRNRSGTMGRTKCISGHPYDAENTYVNPTTGRRYCRACHRIWSKQWRQSH